MDPNRIGAILIVFLLTVIGVKRKWKGLTLALLLTTLFSLTDLSKQVLDGIDRAVVLVDQEKYSWLSSTRGLAVLFILIAWLVREKNKTLFATALICALTLTRLDKVLVDGALGPLSDTIVAIWDWGVAEIKQWIAKQRN